MSVVVIGIGVPGSGKTHFLTRLAEKSGAYYLSSDDLRAELFGDAGHQGDMQLLWEQYYWRLEQALETDQSIICDVKNAKLRDRRTMTHFCRSDRRTVLGLYFKTGLYLCLERNAQRERQVPEGAIRRMAGWLAERPPRRSDGFSELLELTGDDAGEYDKIFQDLNGRL